MARHQVPPKLENRPPRAGRRLRLAVAVGVTLSILALGTTSAPARSKRGGSTETLHVVTRATEINNLVDTGPPGASPGDLYVFKDQIFSNRAATTALGAAFGECVLIEPTTLRYHCTITSRLPAGDVVTGGILVLREGASSTGPVLGGTRRYRNARGQATLKLGPLEGPHDASYTIILRP